MKQPHTIGEVIAERRLTAVGDSSVEVVVRLGKPRPLVELFEDGKNGDMYCPYQIIGVGDEKIRHAAGIDGIQALQLVMLGIGVELARVQRDQGFQLQWEGGEKADLGFPDTHT